MRMEGSQLLYQVRIAKFVFPLLLLLFAFFVWALYPWNLLADLVVSPEWVFPWTASHQNGMFHGTMIDQSKYLGLFWHSPRIL